MFYFYLIMTSGLWKYMLVVNRIVERVVFMSIICELLNFLKNLFVRIKLL